MHEAVTKAGVFDDGVGNPHVFGDCLGRPLGDVCSLRANAALPELSEVQGHDFGHLLSVEAERVACFPINKVADYDVAHLVPPGQRFDRPTMVSEKLCAAVSFGAKVKTEDLPNLVICDLLAWLHMPVLWQNVALFVRRIAVKRPKVEVSGIDARPDIAVMADQFFFTRPSAYFYGNDSTVSRKVFNAVAFAFLVWSGDMHLPVTVNAERPLPFPARITRSTDDGGHVQASAQHVQWHPRRLRRPIRLAEQSKRSLHTSTHKGGQVHGQG